MSDIEAAQIEEAIKQYERYGGDGLRILIAAARAHLATLPRWKEVEVVRWAVITEDGDSIGVFLREEDAKFRVAQRAGLSSIVRLTGTAKVRA